MLAKRPVQSGCGVVCAMLAVACSPKPLPADAGTADAGPPVLDAGDADAGQKPSVPAIGLRRLSTEELVLSLVDLTGVDEEFVRSEATLLPPQLGTFGNDYPSQKASANYIDSLYAVVKRVVAKALDPQHRHAFVGCEPASPSDVGCLSEFSARLAHRAWRRPLTNDELDVLRSLTVYGTAANNFYSAVDAAARTILMGSEFIFRVEFGQPLPDRPGTFSLSSPELATRLAFALTGRTPADWLLDLGEQGKLTTASERRAAAVRLLDSLQGQRHVRAHFRQWLGIEPTTDPNEADFGRETDALIDRVTIKEPGDLMRLFVHRETFVNARLAAHYGLAPPAQGFPSTGWTWVSYADTGRRGVFGHKSLLKRGELAGDSSPVRRGKFIYERLLCQGLGTAPPGVNTDAPPSTPGACKKQRYAAHGSGGCAYCHSRMDPLGFALERFDLSGQRRATEPGHPECTIDESVDLMGYGPITGPDQLAQGLVDLGQLERCAVLRVYEHVFGRLPLADDEGWVELGARRFSASGRQLRELLLDLVESEPFALRREEVAP